MSEFDAIRPYNDNEIAEVLSRLLNDSEFLDSIVKFKLPKLGRFAAPLLRPLVRGRLAKELAHVKAVRDLQALIEGYMQKMIDTTVDTLSISGLENLDSSHAYLFVSNHRDIAMDPAFVNWALFQNGFQTIRIAIGDNLLTKPFASDLMRLNKSFIVNRSAKAPREKLKAAKLLSKYIHHSVSNDNENVWIAQREGRAKDGNDATNPAIISMLALNKAKPETFEEYMGKLRIVPVSISYEYDPCDYSKARELTKIENQGEYTKGEHEDVESIAQGIVGHKGHVHLSFGQPFSGNIEDAEALTQSLDRKIIENYILHPTNCFAYEYLEKSSPMVPVGVQGKLFSELDLNSERKKFDERLAQCDERYRETFLKAYANPVYNKLSLSA